MDENSIKRQRGTIKGNSFPSGYTNATGHTSYLNAPTRRLPPTKKKKPKFPLIISIIIVVILLLSATTTFAYNYYKDTIQNPLNNFIRPVDSGSGSTNIDGRAWNILLLGSDNDSKYNFPNVLTQVMMIAHVDTVNHSIHLVSIPRDSWVALPYGSGMHKIDQAFLLGTNQKNKFEDGVRLARATIEKDYGIPIDRYAWVGLNGFAKVIDTLDGVDIDITHPIVDDTYPDDTGKGSNPNNPNGYKRLYLEPGPQHLTGDEALSYVRSRHADLVGDIGRTERQQQVLTALKQKLNATSVIEHLSQLIKDLTGQVYTDLNQQEMISFANFGRSLNSNAIQRITLGPGPATKNFGTTTSVYDPAAGTKQDVIIPNCDAIQPVVNSIFGLGQAQSCNVTN